MTEFVLIAIPTSLVVGGILGWVLKSYGVTGTISAIQADVTSVQTDMEALKTKVSSIPVITTVTPVHV